MPNDNNPFSDYLDGYQCDHGLEDDFFDDDDPLSPPFGSKMPFAGIPGLTWQNDVYRIERPIPVHERHDKNSPIIASYATKAYNM
jgi:hypothetical protein